MKIRFAQVCFLVVAIASEASAQSVVRTWVSTSGDDTNPCSKASPCRTFNAAIAAVTAGGEVVVLDSGGYGPVTITKNVALIAPPGLLAAIAPTSSSGVDIAANNVTLRGITLNGAYSPGGTGVLVQTGEAVFIENCIIDGWGTVGIHFTASGALYVSNTIIRNGATQGGILMDQGSLHLARSLLENTGTGVRITRVSVVAIFTLTAGVLVGAMAA